MHDAVQCAMVILGAALVICGTAEIRDRAFAAAYDDPDLRTAVAWWAAYYDVMNGRDNGVTGKEHSMLARYLMSERIPRYRRILDDGHVRDKLREGRVLRCNGTVMARDYQKAGRIVFEAGRGMPAA